MRNKLLALLVSFSLVILLSNGLLQSNNVYAADNSISNNDISNSNTSKNMTSSTAYRMQPLKQKLMSLGKKDIEMAIGKFSDLSNHWSREYAGKLAAIEIISGYPDGRFAPDDSVKAAQLIAMTVRALGYKLESGDGNWASPYINTAISLKLISKGEITDYNKTISRQVAAKIIVKATLLSETAPNSTIYNYIRTKIKDYPKINDNYKQAVLEAYALGLFVCNAKGEFNPSGSLTRGEASTIIIRLLDQKIRKPFEADPKDIITLTNRQGKQFQIYPSARSEIFTSIQSLQKSSKNTKGYAFLNYNDYDQIVTCGFHGSMGDFEKDDTSVQLGISIFSLDDKSITHPYSITVFDPAATSKIHMEVIKSFYSDMFGNEAQKAIDWFNKYIAASSNSDLAKDDSFVCNGKKVRMYKVSGDSAFTVWIYYGRN